MAPPSASCHPKPINQTSKRPHSFESDRQYAVARWITTVSYESHGSIYSRFVSIWSKVESNLDSDWIADVMDNHTVQLEGTTLLGKPLVIGKWRGCRLVPAGPFVSSDFNGFIIIHFEREMILWFGSGLTAHSNIPPRQSNPAHVNAKYQFSFGWWGGGLNRWVPWNWITLWGSFLFPAMVVVGSGSYPPFQSGVYQKSVSITNNRCRRLSLSNPLLSIADRSSLFPFPFSLTLSLRSLFSAFIFSFFLSFSVIILHFFWIKIFSSVFYICVCVCSFSFSFSFSLCVAVMLLSCVLSFHLLSWCCCNFELFLIFMQRPPIITRMSARSCVCFNELGWGEVGWGLTLISSWVIRRTRRVRHLS